MENKPTQSGLGRHALLMIACCAIPLLLLAGASIFALNLDGPGNLLVLLMCPLMMFFMMRGMGHDHSGHDQAAHQSYHDSSRVVERKEEQTVAVPSGEKLATLTSHDH